MVNERLWRASQPVRYGSSLDGKFGWKADASDIPYCRGRNSLALQLKERPPQ